MDVFELTRALVDIPSVTEEEKQVGEFLYARLAELAGAHRHPHGRVERLEVAPNRFNLFASWGAPVVTLSTHMDTVPPFFPSREDEEFIWGRGACDAKGILAAMIVAAELLLEQSRRDFGLLFVVGEERNSAGARAAAATPRGSRYLVGGEPTENQLVRGSKGALRFELEARGRMAHSAHPERGASAIDALLDVLADIRRIPLPTDGMLGRTTLNIGTIAGGCAPNVVADVARAELMFRLVGEPGPIREAVARAAAGRAALHEVLHIPALQMGQLDGFPAPQGAVVSFTTDLPFLAEAWGQPFLVGPGSIHVAHTAEERVAKRQLTEAVEIYALLVARLQDARA